MKAITKDYFREIKSRKGQFISMFLIVFIGAAFFSGIRSGKSAMEYTINRYFVDNKFMDIQVVSTVGLDDDDIDKIEDIKGIKKVHPSYSIEAFNDQGTVSYVMKVLAYEKGVNTPIIKEGRNIKSKKECLIDEDYAITAGIDIGDKIKLEADGDKKIKETLKYEEYEVVGIVNHPMYLSIDRGASSIGNGSVDYFMILHRDVFKLDVYTDAYITIDDIDVESIYDEKYMDKLEDITNKVEQLGIKRCENKVNDLKKNRT
jgi:putative ABC transport system permease protein